MPLMQRHKTDSDGAIKKIKGQDESSKLLKTKIKEQDKSNKLLKTKIKGQDESSKLLKKYYKKPKKDTNIDDIIKKNK